jgi:hypothetical protein
LQDDKKEELLNSLYDGLMTFAEVEKESEKLKAVATTKSVFMKEVELMTWDEGENLIPDFANEKVMEKFRVQKGKPLPKTFKVCWSHA